MESGKVLVVVNETDKRRGGGEFAELAAGVPEAAKKAVLEEAEWVAWQRRGELFGATLKTILQRGNL